MSEGPTELDLVEAQKLEIVERVAQEEKDDERNDFWEVRRVEASSDTLQLPGMDSMVPGCSLQVV